MKTGSDKNSFDRDHIWHPFTSLGESNAIHIVSGQGPYLFTQEGRKILDGVSSWWVNLHGHGNPEIAKAIHDQALKLEHVIFAGFTHDPAIELGRNLLSILPKNQKRIFFSDNGSTAVEVAIKMALQYWHNLEIEKKKIIALHGAYHGDTFGAMSVGERGPFTKPFSDLLFDVEFIEVPGAENIAAVEERFAKMCATNEVAAFIFEPLVQGAAGMVMYQAELLDRLMSIAGENNVLCIADEVFTGFGRTGKYFASEYVTVSPDIMAISKGITGGTLPLGVTSCSQKIENAFSNTDAARTFFHGHSYTANPIACAAANASFKILRSEECQASIKRITLQHQLFCKKIRGNPNVSDVRSLGTIMAIEIKSGDGTSYFNDLKRHIYAYFLDRDILLRPLGNIIYFLPPYITTDDELKTVYNAIEDFLNDL